MDNTATVGSTDSGRKRLPGAVHWPLHWTAARRLEGSGLAGVKPTALHLHTSPLSAVWCNILTTSPRCRPFLLSSFGPNRWPKPSGSRCLAAALYLPPSELSASVWLEIWVVCFIQGGKIMKLVFGKGLCNIISLQRRYLRRIMKRRYGMSPVSLSIRHTIKINEER